MMVAVARRTACGAVLAGAAALLAWAGPPAGTVAIAEAQRVDEQIAQLAGLAAWACLFWLAAGALAALGAQLPGALGVAAGRVCARITPALVRRAVEAAVGAAVLTSLTVATAVPALGHTSSRATVATAQELGDAGIGDRPAGPAADELSTTPLNGFDRPAAMPTATPTASPAKAVATPAPTRDQPTRPTTQPDPRAPKTGTARLSPKQFILQQPPVAAAPLPVLAGPPPRATADEIDEVVVRRGDTLWGIAARHLGADATAAEIDAEWRRWYAANRASVGPDPDLIRPGLRLAEPR